MRSCPLMGHLCDGAAGMECVSLTRRSLCAARCSGARGRRTVESKTEDTEGSWDPCSCSDCYTPQHGDCNDCGTTSLRMPLSGVGPVTSFPPVYYPPPKRHSAVPLREQGLSLCMTSLSASSHPRLLPLSLGQSRQLCCRGAVLRAAGAGASHTVQPPPQPRSPRRHRPASRRHKLAALGDPRAGSGNFCAGFSGHGFICGG